MSTRQERIARRRRQKIFRNVFLAGGALLLIVVIAFAFTKKAPGRALSLAQVGQALSDFSLTDIHGETIHLKDYAGQVILLNAWATWCPPCKAEMPDLNTYYQAHQKDGFVILAINGGDSLNQTTVFAEQAGLAFPVLIDENAYLLDRLGIRSLPTSIIVGRDGIVKTIHLGMYTPESLEEEVTPLIQSQ